MTAEAIMKWQQEWLDMQLQRDVWHAEATKLQIVCEQMRDRIAALQASCDRLEQMVLLLEATGAEAADEIERLQAGLLRVMQYEQKCDQTGQPCRSPDRCACSLEAETWCEDTNEANDG